MNGNRPVLIQETKRALLESGRVPLIFNVESYNSTEGKEIPFVTLLLANLSGDNRSDKPLEERQVEFVDRDSLNVVMKQAAPKIKVDVNGKEYDISFNEIDDFRPDRVAQNVPELAKAFDLLRRLNELLSMANTSERVELIKQILNDPEVKKLAESGVSKKPAG